MFWWSILLSQKSTRQANFFQAQQGQFPAAGRAEQDDEEADAAGSVVGCSSSPQSCTPGLPLLSPSRASPADTSVTSPERRVAPAARRGAPRRQPQGSLCPKSRADFPARPAERWSHTGSSVRARRRRPSGPEPPLAVRPVDGAGAGGGGAGADGEEDAYSLRVITDGCPVERAGCNPRDS